MIRRALAENPDSAKSHANLASVLQALGRHDAAIACYEQALVLNPAFADASHGLASTLQTLKQREGDPGAPAKGARDLLHTDSPERRVMPEVTFG